MKTTRVVILAGDSCVGKSELSKRAGQETGCALLDHDLAVMGKLWEVFPSSKKRSLTNVRSRRWERLSEFCDLSFVMQLLHREWFFRAHCPDFVLAFGFCYAIQTWRQVVYDAFADIAGSAFEFAFIDFRPAEDVFFDRLLSTWKQKGHKLATAAVEDQRKDLDRRIKSYTADHFQSPLADEPLSRQLALHTDAEVMDFLRSFLGH